MRSLSRSIAQTPLLPRLKQPRNIPPTFNSIATLNKAKHIAAGTMNLVPYSDSEASENETPSPSKSDPKPVQASASPSFTKIIDRSNQSKSKIKINLSKSQPGERGDVEAEARPAKKQKTGPSFLGGLSLPPAKNLKKPLSNGLGSGVNLKTGPAPAFSRDAAPASSSYDEFGWRESGTEEHGMISIQVTNDTVAQEKEFKPVGNVTRFKPLSVARKKQGQGKSVTVGSAGTAKSSSMASPAVTSHPPSKPKVSLFSMKQDEVPTTKATIPSEYKPILLEPEQAPPPADDNPDTETLPSTSASSSTAPQTVSELASTLNLSASERRQLFGRNAVKGGIPDSIKVTNFSLDAEYDANEELRTKGETVTHNPVRSIAPGKHSLRQLVNAASTQKDALEESFATGKRNKKEGGMKYGW